ncbi:MAG TPA: MFS transporter, partial [Turneriella sp.]|nr:MFS transporter [Turneriella sp.]
MKTKVTATVYLVIFLDMLGFGVLIPVVRDLTQALVVHSGLSWPRPEVYMGILMAVYSGSQMLSAPIWGHLSDRYGRKPIFLLSTIGNVFSYVVWIIANDYWLFLFGRILSGITGGNIAIAQSIIADHTTPEERPRAMGLLGAAIGMGFVLGPFLGGWIINYNHLINTNMIKINQFWSIGVVCLILSIASTIMIIFSHYKEAHKTTLSTVEGFSGVVDAIKSPALRLTYNAHLLSQFSFVIFEVLFAWILQNQYNFDLKETFYFFGIQGLILAFIQGGIYRRVEKKHPPG